jgi:hypothetical protein
VDIHCQQEELARRADEAAWLADEHAAAAAATRVVAEAQAAAQAQAATVSEAATQAEAAVVAQAMAETQAAAAQAVAAHAAGSQAAEGAPGAGEEVPELKLVALVAGGQDNASDGTGAITEE